MLVFLVIVTTYKRSFESDQPNTNIIESKSDFSSCLSPVKKTSKTVKTYSRSRELVAKKSEHLKASDDNNQTIPLTVANLPTEVFEGNARDKKVKEWLDTAKFSQVSQEQIKETVVVDVHIPESEFTALSEEQLKSVTQVDCESIKTTFKHKRRIKSNITPPDLDDIRPFDETNEYCKLSNGMQNQTMKKTTPLQDEFDNLLPQKKKRQEVNSTYAGKNQSSNRRSKRIFPVQSDVFNSVVELVGQNTELKVGKLEDPSQDTLEDFSSGSGEEWVADSKNKKQLSKTRNSLVKKNSNSDECYGRKVTRRSVRLSKNCKTESVNKNEIELSKFAQRNVSESKSSSSNIAKKLEAAFTNAKSVALVEKKTGKLIKIDPRENVIQPSDKQVNDSLKLALGNNQFDTVDKSMPLQRSPGWSRLTTTKKEFHMSEKKKLSLKTLNSSISRSMSDISPVIVEDQSLIESSQRLSNESVVIKNPSSLKENIPIDKVKDNHLAVDLKDEFDKQDSTSKTERVLNKSNASSLSLFKGFLTPKLSKDNKSLMKELYKEDSKSITERVLNNSNASSTSPFKGFSTPKTSKDGQRLPNVERSSNILCNDKIPLEIYCAEGINATKLSSNKSVGSDKCKDQFNLSGTKFKKNVLDLKSTSDVEVTTTLPLVPEEHKGKSSFNALEDVVELSHDFPCPVLYEENLIITSINNAEDKEINLPSVSCEKIQQSDQCVMNVDKISNSLCSQDNEEDKMGYENVTVQTKDLSQNKKRSREPTEINNR